MFGLKKYLISLITEEFAKRIANLDYVERQLNGRIDTLIKKKFDEMVRNEQADKEQKRKPLAKKRKVGRPRKNAK